MSPKHVLIVGLSALAFINSSCGKEAPKNTPPPSTPAAPPASPENSSGSTKPQSDATTKNPQTQPEAGTGDKPSSTPIPQLTPTPAPVPAPPPVPQPTPQAQPLPSPVPVPQPTPVPARPEKPADPHEGEWLFEALKAERIKARVLNTAAITRAIESRFGLVFYEGQIDTMANVAAKMVKFGGAYCTVLATDRYVPQSIQDGLELETRELKEIITQNRYRHLLIMFSDREVGISCMKMTSDPFKVKEVRKALPGIFTLTITN